MRDGARSVRSESEIDHAKALEERDTIAKRNQLSTWFDLYKKWNTLAPLAKRIPTANGPLKLREKSEPYVVVLNTISNIRIPEPVLTNIKSSSDLLRSGSASKGNFATLAVRLTFYSLAAKSFYGSTWISKEHQIQRPSRKKGKKSSSRGTTASLITKLHSAVNITFDEIVYFHSVVDDPSCTLIAELTLTVGNNIEQTKKSYGVGWFILTETFGQNHRDFVTLYRKNKDRDPYGTDYECTVRVGTPRALLFINPNELGTTVDKVGTGKMLYSVYRHTGLRKCMHLMKEDELVGALDVLPGLYRTSLQGSDRARTEYADVPVVEARKKDSTDLMINNIRVKLQPGFEKQFLEEIKKQLDRETHQSVVEQVLIEERRGRFFGFGDLIDRSKSSLHSFLNYFFGGLSELLDETTLESDLFRDKLENDENDGHHHHEQLEYDYDALLGVRTEKVEITKRELCVCVHNARTFVKQHVDGHWIRLELEPTRDDESTLTTIARQRTKLHRYVADPHYAVVFQMEYEVRLPPFGNLPSVKRTFPVGTHLFLPYKGPFPKPPTFRLQLRPKNGNLASLALYPFSMTEKLCFQYRDPFTSNELGAATAAQPGARLEVEMRSSGKNEFYDDDYDESGFRTEDQQGGDERINEWGQNNNEYDDDDYDYDYYGNEREDESDGYSSYDDDDRKKKKRTRKKNKS
eukprot:g2387.t1